MISMLSCVGRLRPCPSRTAVPPPTWASAPGHRVHGVADPLARSSRAASLSARSVRVASK